MLENNAVKRRAFCMRKRVNYVTAHAQKFSDITICIHVFHLSKLFTYLNIFGQLVQWGSDNRGCTVYTCGSITCYIYIAAVLYIHVAVLPVTYT